MSATYFLTVNSAGVVDGSGYTPDGTVPQGAYPCTKAQAQAPNAWQIQGGQIVGVPVQPPSIAQQGLLIFKTGVQVSSASVPDARNGTYALDAETRSDIQAELLSLIINGTFTNGAVTIDWPDASLGKHSFDVPGFKSFATVYGAFVGALKVAIAANEGPLPTQPIQVA